MPIVPFFNPNTGASGGPPASSVANSWVTIEDYQWDQQATSTALVGAGTAVMGGKSITNALVSGTPTSYQSQVVNGQGLVWTSVATTGGAIMRFDLVPGNYNPGEQILVEYAITGIASNIANLQLYWGIGSGTHYSQSEWHGIQTATLTGGLLQNYSVRGYSTAGGARSTTILTNQSTAVTSCIVQIWFDGSYMSRVGIKPNSSTLPLQPIVGNASPFDATMSATANTGTGGSVAPTLDLGGCFSTTLRAELGFLQQNSTFALKRHRISRPVRMT